MRLIDADAMMKRLEEWNTNDSMDKALYNFTLCRINEQQTIEERKTGKWLYAEKHVTYNDGRRAIYSSWGCSECGTYFDEGCFWHYCPHCGAKMEDADD